MNPDRGVIVLLAKYEQVNNLIFYTIFTVFKQITSCFEIITLVIHINLINEKLTEIDRIASLISLGNNHQQTVG